VASFTDANPDAAPGSFTAAAINLGDSTQSTGTITFFNGAFYVNGSHAYADEAVSRQP
jgi:hypothetical protein